MWSPLRGRNKPSGLLRNRHHRPLDHPPFTGPSHTRGVGAGLLPGGWAAGGQRTGRGPSSLPECNAHPGGWPLWDNTDPVYLHLLSMLIGRIQGCASGHIERLFTPANYSLRHVCLVLCRLTEALFLCLQTAPYGSGPVRTGPKQRTPAAPPVLSTCAGSHKPQQSYVMAHWSTLHSRYPGQCAWEFVHSFIQSVPGDALRC